MEQYHRAKLSRLAESVNETVLEWKIFNSLLLSLGDTSWTGKSLILGPFHCSRARAGCDDPCLGLTWRDREGPPSRDPGLTPCYSEPCTVASPFSSGHRKLAVGNAEYEEMPEQPRRSAVEASKAQEQ
ncbi:hypothetical protein ElyMa_006959400 [Elysia marginata]|uniref:Uncharacterized protein n=1 Tax=Elysia marginata TaxID=1093978 RepID=A0AAV4JQ92_9GAST|nr:hypothetical protein ElyMa_006959400 [Elysia marginata]